MVTIRFSGSRDFQTGLHPPITIWAGDVLAGTTTASESPAGSATYKFTFAANPSTAYRWTAANGSGSDFRSGSFSTDAAGALITDASILAAALAAGAAVTATENLTPRRYTVNTTELTSA